MKASDTSKKIPLGISACLIGEPVRYDGGSKHDAFLTDTLGPAFDYVPVCPEVGCGLSVPREPMRLVGTPESNCLVGIKTGTDFTEQMQAFCSRTIEGLRARDLHGFIFKAKSPSSGLYRVPLFTPEGDFTAQHTSGLFARAFVRAFPHLPCEEDVRLHDPVVRETFIERVFELKRFREEVESAPSVSALQAFHAGAKYLLMAHSPEGLNELGRLAAGAVSGNLSETVADYAVRLLAVMAEPATVGRHVNALQHMQGYFGDRLSAQERDELAYVLDEYAREQVPLLVPLTLFRHHVFKHQCDYLMRQHNLCPYPSELMLRYHA